MSLKEKIVPTNTIENLDFVAVNEKSQRISLNKLYLIKRILLFFILFIILIILVITRLTLNVSMTNFPFDKNLTNLSILDNKTLNN
jgi:hypothetical protein